MNDREFQSDPGLSAPLAILLVIFVVCGIALRACGERPAPPPATTGEANTTFGVWPHATAVLASPSTGR